MVREPNELELRHTSAIELFTTHGINVKKKLGSWFGC